MKSMMIIIAFITSLSLHAAVRSTMLIDFELVLEPTRATRELQSLTPITLDFGPSFPSPVAIWPDDQLPSSLITFWEISEDQIPFFITYCLE